MTEEQLSKRVLSIQSHVVSGYVGNKSATFPLQILGYEVDSINSVQFSNHTGYKSFKGQLLGADELWDLYEGLKDCNLNNYSHLLTGFICSEALLLKVCDVVTDLKKTNPSLHYVCDPVMGDLGKMYVPKELLPIYQQHVLPLADIITPNQFEAELLSGMKISDESSACAAMKKLHEMGADVVVISSTDFGECELLVGLGSTIYDGKQSCIRMEMERLPHNFTGTGDLFASLLLAWLGQHPNNLQLACEKAQSTMQAVLKRTSQYALSLCDEGVAPGCRELELRLVQSKRDIEQPTSTVHATQIS